LAQMGARVYDPTLGRFLQTDPIQGAGPNAYDYVGQDPVNQNDLSGTASKWRTWRNLASAVDHHGWFGKISALVRIQTASYGRARVQFEIRTSGLLRESTFKVEAWIQDPYGHVHHDQDFTFLDHQGVAHPSAAHVPGGTCRVWGYADYEEGFTLHRTYFYGTVEAPPRLV
jgi:uncharacterized protein RhaS with RHS repeats